MSTREAVGFVLANLLMSVLWFLERKALVEEVARLECLTRDSSGVPWRVRADGHQEAARAALEEVRRLRAERDALLDQNSKMRRACECGAEDRDGRKPWE